MSSTERRISGEEHRSELREGRNWLSWFRNSSTSSSSRSFVARREQQRDTSRRPSAPVYVTDASPFQRPSTSRQSQPEEVHSRAKRSTGNNSSSASEHSESEQAIPAAPDPNPHLSVPIYQFRNPKGKVLIVNIEHFFNQSQRLGSQHDLDGLRTLFGGNMKFDVEFHTNLKARDIEQHIRKFRKSLKLYDISIVVLMSHGTNILGKKKKEIPGGYTRIFGSDGGAVETHDILSKFTAEKCPDMKGKPKIFIFQCCRGKRSETLARDDDTYIPNVHADMLVAYSTLPGFDSARFEETGSWYIQAICKVFAEYASTRDVESLFRMVNVAINTQHEKAKQTSMYENRGFKTCFLQHRCDNFGN